MPKDKFDKEDVLGEVADWEEQQTDFDHDATPAVSDAAIKKGAELAEQIESLIEHFIKENPEAAEDPELTNKLKDAVDNAIEPFFESCDPRDMGWVGSNGQP